LRPHAHPPTLSRAGAGLLLYGTFYLKNKKTAEKCIKKMMIFSGFFAFFSGFSAFFSSVF